MARGKRYQPEQVVNLRRQIEVAVANGKTTAQACKEAEIVEQTYFRWRKEYGGLQVQEAIGSDLGRGGGPNRRRGDQLGEQRAQQPLRPHSMRCVECAERNGPLVTLL
jgi:hypothetical protein